MDFILLELEMGDFLPGGDLGKGSASVEAAAPEAGDDKDWGWSWVEGSVIFCLETSDNFDSGTEASFRN